MSASTEPAHPTTVFVYGTLMPGERNAGVAGPPGSFVTRAAALPGHRLLHLDPERYPAAVPGEAGELVRGHALTYTPTAWVAALPLLDDLEGVHETPPLYRRVAVRLHLDAGGELDAWVYLYAQTRRLRQPGAVPVPGGDWRAVPDRDRPRPGDR
ncbi:gamma-glutamylcyclotransferase family protein [Deinococcus petrolearius]|uniref:Putative gamma-glutamylcyclotransferase n=1 Tax=Deinococcus petrolearius TaxID=1751295 RepID=A0ABW1DQ27_9DEIO